MTRSFDSYDQAVSTVERLYELGNELPDVPVDSRRWQEIEKEIRTLFAEDVEHVTRDGTISGPDRFITDVRVQHARFAISYEIDLREGRNCVVVLQRVRRQMRDSPSDYLTVSSGAVFRIRDGKVVFLEGYPDGRDALAAAGDR